MYGILLLNTFFLRVQRDQNAHFFVVNEKQQTLHFYPFFFNLILSITTTMLNSSNPNVCIVVARYNENVQWTKCFSNVIIYNKGDPLPLNEFNNQIFLNNVGREGHTYYKHIYDNYDSLADFTVFVQANPFDHSPNIMSVLPRCIANINDIDFTFLSELILQCNLSGCMYHCDLPLIDTYEQLFGEKKEQLDFEFGAGAQFIVSKHQILQRPREFYLKIVEMLNNSVNPIEGFVIERFHKLILKPI